MHLGPLGPFMFLVHAILNLSLPLMAPVGITLIYVNLTHIEKWLEQDNQPGSESA
jgi:hypothetical protein